MAASLFVDYAHKPEALAAAITALPPVRDGPIDLRIRLRRRPGQGQTPDHGADFRRRADITIVTDDNPRSEQPAQIRKKFLPGQLGRSEIGDRAEAISTAVKMMMPGDVVLVAGKGHETGQIIGDRIVPFSDHDEIRRALAS